MKKMMLAFLIVPALFIFACSSALQVTEIDSWLSAKGGGAKASVNITGKWQDSMNESDSFLSLGQGSGWPYPDGFQETLADTCLKKINEPATGKKLSVAGSFCFKQFKG